MFSVWSYTLPCPCPCVRVRVRVRVWQVSRESCIAMGLYVARSRVQANPEPYVFTNPPKSYLLAWVSGLCLQTLHRVFCYLRRCLEP